MAYIVMAYIGMAYIGMAYIVMVYVVTVYNVMAHIVMAYIVMDYIGEAHAFPWEFKSTLGCSVHGQPFANPCCQHRGRGNEPEGSRAAGAHGHATACMLRRKPHAHPALIGTVMALPGFLPRLLRHHNRWGYCKREAVVIDWQRFSQRFSL